MQTPDFYMDMNVNVLERLDTSNYSNEHNSGIETGVNKKMFDKFKNECRGAQKRSMSEYRLKYLLI